MERTGNREPSDSNDHVDENLRTQMVYEGGHDTDLDPTANTIGSKPSSLDKNVMTVSSETQDPIEEDRRRIVEHERNNPMGG